LWSLSRPAAHVVFFA